MQLHFMLKPIVVKAYKLPNYARKTRNFKDKRVLVLRDELLSTQNPYELLYKKFQKFVEQKILKLIQEFDKVYSQLNKVYENLIKDFKSKIIKFFSLILISQTLILIQLNLGQRK